MTKRRTLAWLAAFTVVVALAGVGDARACGSEYGAYIETPAAPRPPRNVGLTVSAAEKSMSDGKWAAAAIQVVDGLPAIRTLTPGKDALVNRGLKAMALATVRNEGTLPLGKPWNAKTPAERSANLEWAVTALRALSAQRGDDPGAKTDLAESLSKLWSHQTEAREILEGLAKDDLVTSPQGWSALARVRGWAGDPLGRDVAMARCRKMSDKDGVCEPARPAPVRGSSGA